MVVCTVDAGAGKGMVPSAALGKLVPGGNASIGVSATSTTSLKAGADTVTFALSAAAVDATGSLAGAAKVDLK